MSDMSGKASRAEVEHCGPQLRYNGASGMSDIEHVAMGNARVDGNAARVAGASTR